VAMLYLCMSPRKHVGMFADGVYGQLLGHCSPSGPKISCESPLLRLTAPAAPPDAPSEPQVSSSGPAAPLPQRCFHRLLLSIHLGNHLCANPTSDSISGAATPTLASTPPISHHGEYCPGSPVWCTCHLHPEFRLRPAPTSPLPPTPPPPRATTPRVYFGPRPRPRPRPQS